MVRQRVNSRKRASKLGCYCRKTPKIRELAEYLFNYCSHCGCDLCDMAVPQGAFAAFKVRESEQKMSGYYHSQKEEFNSDNRQQRNGFGGGCLNNTGLLSPLQYNSKLMNSIWGMYNRYSVHNLKKNMDDANALAKINQQMQSVGNLGSSDSKAPGIRVTAAKSLLMGREYSQHF